MSWFPEVPPQDDDEKTGALIADGVLVERRDVIKISLGALAVWSLGWPQLALAEDAGAPKTKSEPDNGELAWDALLKEAIPMAEKLATAPKPNEDAYLFQLAALVARLKPVPDVTFKGDKPVIMVDTYRKLPFIAAQFQIQPGAAIPFHDHRDYIGVLTCVSGEASIRSFDIVGEDRRPPKGKSFEIRETFSGILSPARVSTLSRTRDNIHDVRAGKEAVRLLDFFTFFKKEGYSAYMDVAEKPRDAEKKIYEANWK
jgi:hypothetical protein